MHAEKYNYTTYYYNASCVYGCMHTTTDYIEKRESDCATQVNYVPEVVLDIWDTAGETCS